MPPLERGLDAKNVEIDMRPGRMIARSVSTSRIERRTPSHPTDRTIVGRLSSPLMMVATRRGVPGAFTTAAAIRRPASNTPKTGWPPLRWSLSSDREQPG